MNKHEAAIEDLRASNPPDTGPLTYEQVCELLAADLLEAHDETGISLDHWITAREFVEHHVGFEIYENGA